MNHWKHDELAARVQAENRTFFFDVKGETSGKMRFVITESKFERAGEFQRTRISIPEKHLRKFLEVAGEVACKAGLLKSAVNSTLGDPLNVRPATKANNKPVSTSLPYAEIRKDFSNAYRPWTQEDDSHLTRAYETCKEIETLANTFQRKPGAIQSRLVKLGLVD